MSLAYVVFIRGGFSYMSYRQKSNISRTKLQNLNVSRLVENGYVVGAAPILVINDFIAC